MTLNTFEGSIKVFDKMCLGAQQHTADKIGRRDTGSTLDNLETTSLLDESIAILAVAVGSDVVAVNDILAAVV